MEFNINIKGNRIPTVQSQKILGLVFDSLHLFNSHATYTLKGQKPEIVFKPHAGSLWGMDKETIVGTQKAIGRFLFNCAEPVYTLFLSDTQWRVL